MRAALSAKFAQDNVFVVDEIGDYELEGLTPVQLCDAVDALGAGEGLTTLVVAGVSEVPAKLRAASDATINQVGVLPVCGVNVYDLMRFQNLVLTVEALDALTHHLTRPRHRGYFGPRDDERPGPLVDHEGNPIHYPGVSKLQRIH